MISPKDEEIEAAAMVQLRMPREFGALLVLVATNAANDSKAAIARGASVNREENCGRAQAWLELQTFLAGAADRWADIEKQRSDQQRQEAEFAAGRSHDPYENHLGL
jgi:hypothetical protein